MRRWSSWATGLEVEVRSIKAEVDQKVDHQVEEDSAMVRAEV